MTKFSAKKDNTTVLFLTEEEAINYAKSMGNGWEYEKYNAWGFYNPKSDNNNKNEELIGSNLIQCIEDEFIRLTKVMGLYGASGYHLKNVVLRKTAVDKATLIVSGWSFSDGLVEFTEDMFCDENLKTLKLEFSGVSPEDVPLKGEYTFEIKRGK